MTGTVMKDTSPFTTDLMTVRVINDTSPFMVDHFSVYADLMTVMVINDTSPFMIDHCCTFATETIRTVTVTNDTSPTHGRFSLVWAKVFCFCRKKTPTYNISQFPRPMLPRVGSYFPIKQKRCNPRNGCRITVRYCMCTAVGLIFAFFVFSVAS